MSRIPLLLALFSTACGDDGDAACTPDDGNLSGIIGGQDWSFAQGATDSFLSDADGLFTTLFSDTFDTCDSFSAPDGGSLLLNIPTEPGEYPFDLSDNMTFYVPPSDNLVATTGLLIVEEVTDTTVSASVCATYDADNEVSGSFTADICP